MNTPDDDYGGRWPEDIYTPPRRRTGARIVAIALLLALGLLGWAAEKRYHIAARVTRNVEPAAQADPRVETLLADGERALAEGQLDLAQSDFDKASVLKERDTRVLIDEARSAIARADVPWLELRLIVADAAVERRTIKAQLDERASQAGKAADEAWSAAPHDPQALCAKLDALRLAGDLDGARGYVVAVFAQASQPETAYALAALDLAQASPPWPAVVERLRLAAAGEGSAARARAALVYALVSSGDLAGAKAELVKLEALPRPYPLLPRLHSLVAGSERIAAATPASVQTTLPDAAAADSASPLPQAAANTPPAAIGESNRPTPRSALQSAAEAMRSGDFDRAERIYQAVVTAQPNDSQALAGLGDVLRLRGDPWGAIDAYQRAIAVNPSYLPALLGLGDVQWGRGDHAAASRTYKQIIDHFPEGTYPQYVKQRGAGGP
jgi:tetratricopeptide (TPR) repeat protein